ncbi:hypothetical protein F7725_008860 [Dissostichus mawsoni]|uniref:Uncharacterized protein n=1 Tax=Dissostichus mawsoni TaxID=36200 RepID=A0A7J5Z753_DISMA|nr:hypothetical protein F7725_008860 [Dissostichus mawsoni]
MCVINLAQKIVACRKKQQLSIGPCKSLPNSPSHTSVCTAPVTAVHSRKASEPEKKSLENRADSIGSGRAIPIKQDAS